MSLMIDNISAVIPSISEPTCEQLVDILMSLQAHRTSLTEEIPLPNELPYGRKVLYASRDAELILVHIPPQSATRIHDHGRSVGAAIVLEGHLVNVIYQLDANGTVQPVVEQHAHCDETYLAGPNQIHQMRNPFADRVVSLHLYSPPLSGVQVYAEDRD